jgi:uroporphyrinogen-III synthase
MEKPSPVQILSTRALGNGARDFIHHENWVVDIVSMIETHGVITGDQIAGFIQDCKDAGENSFLLFSSENAVKWLKWGFDKFGFKIPAGLKAVCVGNKTSDTAAEWLDVEPILSEKNSEALLNKLKERFPVGTSFFFFCGSKRLDTLPDGLREAGFGVEEYLVYKTELTPHKIIREYEAVLFFSPSAVESFFMVNFWERKMVAVSIGRTTFEKLKMAGVETILLADEPNERAMLAKLDEYLKDRF